MDKPVTIENIKKFLANECNYLEAEEIAVYLEEHIEELDRLNIFDDKEEREIMILPYELKQRIYNEILPKNVRRVTTWKRVLAVACVVGVMLGIFLINNRQNKPEEISKPASAVLLKNIVNNGDDTMHVSLPDGSGLILNPMAAITYRDDFTSVRNIQLDSGNAYFIVAKDTAHPFSVFANGIKTTALGTEFWVENEMAINSIKVKLASGKVAVVSTDKKFTMDSVYLKPGQVCWVDKRTGNVKVSSENMKKSTGSKTVMIKEETDAGDDVMKNEIVWTNENMKFSNATLANIFSKIENSYNVKVIVKDPAILKASMTGTIFYSDSLDFIIKTISELNKLSYEIKNDSVFIGRK